MPQPGQKCVTIPAEVYDRVREEVENGNEKSVAQAFVKAVKNYLDRKYEFVNELRWLKENKKELNKLLGNNRS